RGRAAEALGRIGPAAKEAVPALARAMKDKDEVSVRAAAAEALGRVGAAAVPELIEALKGKDAGQRALAAGALGRIGPGAKEAVPALEKVLDDKTIAEPARKAIAKIRKE